MEILIITKNKKDNFSKKIKKKFPQLKIKQVWKNKLKKQDFKNKKLIITIGGDGTFLSASHFIEDQLILGVNSDKSKSEGALTPIELHKLERKIKNIFKGKIKIKQYQRELVQIIKKHKCVKTEFALNETFIGNRNPHHPSNYIIKHKNKKEKQRSSGILISTGTGSTAWYKTMGGRKFRRTKKQLRFKIREPYSRRIHKSRIKKGKINQNQKLIITSLMNHGLLAIDSIRTYPIHLNDIIEISIGKPLNAIQ